MSEIPYGYCHCGCGKKTNEAAQTNTKYGYVKGQLMRFVLGHHVRVKPKRPVSERFWSKVAKTSDSNKCWEWQAAKNTDGYGNININKKSKSAHRIAWELTYGEIPLGLEVCHNCPDGDNPACVNPNHLFLGTHLDNIKDMDKKGRRPDKQKRILNAARGERLPQHKLTLEQVRYIRKRYSEGNISQYDLADEMGVKQTAISNIVLRKTWRESD